MPETQPIKVRGGDVVVLVGTMKGAFIFRAGPDRARFEMGGPWFPGHSVYSMSYDGRGDRRRVWAAASSMHWGALLNHSDDFGATWTTPEVPTVRFPEGTKALQNIWQIAPGRADEPDVVYCGVEPAALFESRDGGKSFALVEGLWQHPHREKWQPGGGGLCLHTVLPDPSRKGRITVACTGPTTAAEPGRFATRECARSFFRIRTRSSASACTRSCETPPGPTASICKITGDCTGATTAATRGATLPTEFPRTSGSAWPPTRATSTPSTSSRSNPTGSAARRKESCACTARATQAARGIR